MSEIKNGTIISELDKEYNFSYDGKLLQLTPKNIEEVKSYDFLVDRRIELDLLEGITVAGEKIFFLKCELIRNYSAYIAKPAGYITFTNNEKSFCTMSLSGEIINYFYRPNQIYDDVNSNYSFEHVNKGLMIQLKPLNEIIKEFEIDICGQTAKVVLSITAPGEPLAMKQHYSLGEPYSILRIDFLQDISVEMFADIYLWLVNFFGFLNFQKHVTFNKIKLGRFNEEYKVEQVGEVYLVHKEQMQLGHVDRTIGFYFVEERMNSLLNILNAQKLNLLFIPKEPKDRKYIDPQKYITCCTSFESVFNFVFPKAKEEEKPEFATAKNELIAFLEQKDAEYKGNNGVLRKQFASLRQIIEYADYGLAEKFRYCEKKYSNVIIDFKTRILQQLNISNDEEKEIATDFATLRNCFTHSSMSAIQKTHIAAYSMAQCYIYVMILDKAKVPENSITQAVNLLFV